MIIDQLFTRPIFESQMDPITQFASNAHEAWRRNFDPTGTKPRIKKNSDGTEGDINVPFADLHPDWQKENLAAGRAAQHAVKHFGNNIEKAAEFIHRQWMKRNPKADYNAAQHVPYDDLSDDEKEKDRVHVRTMMQLMGHHPEQGVEEVAPPGAKAERMVRHIKQGYARDGKLTPKEKGIAFATAWKAHNAGRVEEQGITEGTDDPAKDALIQALMGHSVDDPRELWVDLKHIGRKFKTPVSKQIRMALRSLSPDDAYELWDTALEIAGVTQDELDNMTDDMDDSRDVWDGNLRGVSPPATGQKKTKHKIHKTIYIESQGVAEGYTGRETKAGTWRVFKDGNAVAVAGPFKSADQAAAWIKKHKQGITEMDKSQPAPGRDGSPRSGPDREGKPITSKQMQDQAFEKLKQLMSKPEHMAILKRLKTKEGVAEGSIKDVEAKIRAHDQRKADREQEGDPYVAHELHSHNVIRKQLLDKRKKAQAEYHKRMDQQGVAEGSGGNWYIRVNGKILNDTKFKPMIFSSEDEARSHAMKLADKKRIPLSQIKLTKSWMDAPEQGVAEGDTLMLKLKRAMVREGRVKELALDLKTMPDADFMKKYGKVKAAIRKDMKRVDEKLATSDTLSRPAAGASSLGRAIDDPDIMGSLKSASTPKFDRLGKTGGEPELDFRAGLGNDETEIETDPRLAAEPNKYMQSWGGKFAVDTPDNRPAPGSAQWQYVINPNYKAEKEVQWIPSSEADSIASWKANNPGKSAADWGSIPAASKSSAASGSSKMRWNSQTRAQEKFDPRTGTWVPVPADGSGANPNIDDATRDRARAWAAQQNAPGAALAGAMRSSGNPVDTAKNKTDWKSIYALNKATIGSNPDIIKPRMQLNMPNGTIYLVQPGDTLTKIAAKQNQVNELSTEKLAQYKTAAAQDARAADKAGDVKRGDKRFHGIVQATKKQFDNDAKKVDENYQSLTEANYLGWLMKVKDMIWKIFKSKVKPTVPSSADARFQQMMGKITEPIDPSRLQNLYQEYKSNPQYYIPTPSYSDSPEILRYWTASLADFVMNKFPNADHDVLANLGGNLAELAVKESLRAIKENVSKVSESRAARRALMAKIVNGN